MDGPSVWLDAGVMNVSPRPHCSTQESETGALGFIIKGHSALKTGSHLPKMKVVLGVVSKCIWLYSKFTSQASPWAAGNLPGLAGLKDELQSQVSSLPRLTWF